MDTSIVLFDKFYDIIYQLMQKKFPKSQNLQVHKVYSKL